MLLLPIYQLSTFAGDKGNIMKRDRTEWVQQCLKDFETIHPGMTRQEIKKKFPMDGGLQSFSAVRFVHPDCPYFKIDVEFELKKDIKNRNRAIHTQEDMAIKISKPYIERPIID